MELNKLLEASDRLQPTIELLPKYNDKNDGDIDSFTAFICQRHIEAQTEYIRLAG